jgi:uncharacterized protein YjbI with pentapeptide repeats
MPNDEHVAILKKGVVAWNAWRDENPDIRPNLANADHQEANLQEANLRRADLRRASFRGADLSGANLLGARLHGADLSRADLSRADLAGAVLWEANLREADLNDANLKGAYLRRANFRRANLSEASLGEADLSNAILSDANLSGAYLLGARLNGANLRRANLTRSDLVWATLVQTDLTGADLTGCHIYGVSAWDLKLKGAKQQNLIITRWNEPEISVDNIGVAQFIYLMLHNQKIRDVIDTITSKVVLILGRFKKKRKAVLDALRDELRKRNYLPILFDFSVPATRDITETISLLARMARFVVADITDAKSIPQELSMIVPDLPSVPVQPLLLKGSAEYGMFEHFKRFPWVLETYEYASSERLVAGLSKHVIGPAEKYAQSVREATTQRGARQARSSSRTRKRQR